MSVTKPDTYTASDGMVWTIECVCPPIPWRGADWQATSREYEPGHPVAEGETRAACIAAIEEITADGYDERCSPWEPDLMAPDWRESAYEANRRSTDPYRY